MTGNTDSISLQRSRIYWMRTLNDFGLSFVSIFIPVYLLGIGYDIKAVLFWSILRDISFLFFMFLSVRTSNGLGLVHNIQIRFIFVLSYLLFLPFIKSHSFLFFVCPVILGLDWAFFYIPLNVLTVRFSTIKNAGEVISKLSSYPSLVSIFCPLIGGLIANHFGYNFLFVVALVIVFISWIPLWSLRSEKTDFVFNRKSVIRIWQENKNLFIPEVISSMVGSVGGILTLYVFIKLLNVTQLGVVGTIMSIGSAIFTLIIGKYTDNGGKHKLIKYSAVVASLVLFGCYAVSFSPNKWVFYLATFLFSLTSTAFIVPYFSILFNNARKDDAQFLVLREIPNVAGRFLLYGLAIIFSNNLSNVFIISGVVLIFYWFFDTKKLVKVNA